MTGGKNGQGLASLIMGMALTAIIAVAIVKLTQDATQELNKTDNIAIVTALHKLGIQKITTKEFFSKYLESGTNEYNCLNGVGTNCLAYSGNDHWRVLNAKRVLAGGTANIDISSATTPETQGCFSKTLGSTSPDPVGGDICPASHPYYREILFRLKCATDNTCTQIETKVRTEYHKFTANGTLQRLYVRENEIPISLFAIIGRQLSGSIQCADGEYLQGFDSTTGELNCKPVNPSQLTTFASNFNINGSCTSAEFGMSSTNNHTGSVYCASETLALAAPVGALTLPVSSASSSSSDSSASSDSSSSAPTGSCDSTIPLLTTSYPSGIYDIIVPNNAEEMNVKLWGAGGKRYNQDYPGGWGGYTEATFPVSTTSTLNSFKLIVGTSGAITNNHIGFGGVLGGGGLTGIFIGLSSITDSLPDKNRALAIAGGGGGANQIPYNSTGHGPSSSAIYKGFHGNQNISDLVDQKIRTSFMSGQDQDSKGSGSDAVFYGNGAGGGYEGGKIYISGRKESIKGSYGGTAKVSSLALGSIDDGRIIIESYNSSVGNCSIRNNTPGLPQNICVGNGNSTNINAGSGYAIITFNRCAP